ncbi:MAG TPA: DUF4336 domain-containing protein [Candidatus Binatia bacterium]|jgi:hypothetical protein
MSQHRSLADRLMQHLRPRPVPGFAPPACELDRGIWTLERQLRMPGGPVLPSRTTILRLASGGLVVISPPARIAEDGADDLDAIGEVRYVVAPNSFHYVYCAEFLRRYPRASLLVTPGLSQRVPSLPEAIELGPRAPEEWNGQIEVAVLGPLRGLSETAFFHCESGSLILTDVAFHMTRFARGFDRVAWRLSGVPAGFGPSRTARTLLLTDRTQVAAFLERLLAWPLRRIVVAHGEVIAEDAGARLRDAFHTYLAGG